MILWSMKGCSLSEIVNSNSNEIIKQNNGLSNVVDGICEFYSI